MAAMLMALTSANADTGITQNVPVAAVDLQDDIVAGTAFLPAASILADNSGTGTAANKDSASKDAPVSAEKEMRGLWVATVVNIDYPSKPTTDPEILKKKCRYTRHGKEYRPQCSIPAGPAYSGRIL